MIHSILLAIRLTLYGTLLQLLGLAGLDIWSRLASDADQPRTVITRWLELYEPGISVFQQVVPEAWLSRGGLPWGILSICFAAILYSACLGVSISLLSLARRTARRRARRED